MRGCRSLTDLEIRQLLDALSAPAWRRERTLIHSGFAPVCVCPACSPCGLAMWPKPASYKIGFAFGATQRKVAGRASTCLFTHKPPPYYRSTSTLCEIAPPPWARKAGPLRRCRGWRTQCHSLHHRRMLPPSGHRSAHLASRPSHSTSSSTTWTVAELTA